MNNLNTVCQACELNLVGEELMNGQVAKCECNKSGFQVGQYVSYKFNTHMVTKTHGYWVWIIDPRLGNVKLKVNYRNLKATRFPSAKVVTHQYRQFIVTGKGTIISVTTGKVMQWGEENGDRIAILAK